MTDILSLSNWAVLSVEQGNELIIKAEYLVQPDCCLKCGSEHFYKHGPKTVAYRTELRDLTMLYGIDLHIIFRRAINKNPLQLGVYRGGVKVTT